MRRSSSPRCRRTACARAAARRAALVARRVLVSATKGLETDSLDRMSQLMKEEIGAGHPIAVLSGPELRARSRPRALPTAVVVASADATAATRVQDSLKGPTLRLYASDDVTGCRVRRRAEERHRDCRRVVEGLGIGHNAMAALITRGLVEMSRLACARAAGVKRSPA
jgi:glycerol-3-phosphate dehydrogenase (NAD(P)+)